MAAQGQGVTHLLPLRSRCSRLCCLQVEGRIWSSDGVEGDEKVT
jgi:hypothetical protein